MPVEESHELNFQFSTNKLFRIMHYNWRDTVQETKSESQNHKGSPEENRGHARECIRWK